MKFPIRKINISHVGILLTCCLVVACTNQPIVLTDSGVVLSAEKTQLFNQWLDEQFEEYLVFSPLLKTSLGDKRDYDKLDDESEAAELKVLQWRRNSVAKMKQQFQRQNLDEQGRISWDLWQRLLDRSEAGLPFIRHRFFLGRYGPHTSLPRNLISSHKVDDLSDMEAYISRLRASHRYFAQYLQRAKQSSSEGIRPPYFTYDVSISQMERVTSGQPFDNSENDSALWADINSKLGTLRQKQLISAKQEAALREEARVALVTKLAPIYAEMSAWLEADKKNVNAEAKGASELPNGEAFYNYRLEQMTTLPLAATDIHATGLKEVARIHSEMNQLRRRVGFAGDLKAFFEFMRNEPQFYLPSTDEGRAEYIRLASAQLDKMEKRLPDFFGILPKAKLEVRRVEAYREQAGAAAHYHRGTKDGSRPGIFYAHLLDMKAVPAYRLENLAYHEGLPGHHMQISIQQEVEGLPRFRTHHGYTAFSEGWGLYAEFLAKEMGGYEDDYSDFGRLSGELWRAVRLVVDTGIHAFSWSEQRAINYALQNSPKPSGAVKSEIWRYFNTPAQATAYKIGMLKIQALRAHAETKLGEKFDIKAFHDLVIGSGPLPLALLEARVENWISKQR